MSKRELAAWALALAVAAPGVTAQTLSRSLPVAPIKVSVVDGQIRVSSTSVRVGAGAVTISWQLSGEGWRFTSSSIDFGDANGYFSCSTFNSGLGVRCTKSEQAPGGQLPYRIQLSDGRALVALPQPDILIMND